MDELERLALLELEQMAHLCAKDMKFYKGLFDALEALNMARDNFVLKTLLEKGVVTFKPHGNSMTPKIDSGDQVVVKKVSAKALRVGDAVYAKVKGAYYLHLLTAIGQDGYQISNNHGHVNGWAKAESVFGVCVQVKEKVLISDEELKEREK